MSNLVVDWQYSSKPCELGHVFLNKGSLRLGSMALLWLPFAVISSLICCLAFKGIPAMHYFTVVWKHAVAGVRFHNWLTWAQEVIRFTWGFLDIILVLLWGFGIVPVFFFSSFSEKFYNKIPMVVILFELIFWWLAVCLWCNRKNLRALTHCVVLCHVITLRW